MKAIDITLAADAAFWCIRSKESKAPRKIQKDDVVQEDPKAET
jgi:hypothetical protein